MLCLERCFCPFLYCWCGWMWWWRSGKWCIHTVQRQSCVVALVPVRVALGDTGEGAWSYINHKPYQFRDFFLSCLAALCEQNRLPLQTMTCSHRCAFLLQLSRTPCVPTM